MSTMQITIGKGNFIITSTVNGLIFKEISNINNTDDLGKKVNPKQYQNDIVNSITLYFQNYEEIQELRNLLSKSYDTKTFSFKYIDFDFTDYNRKCVDCIIDQLNWIEKFMPSSSLI